MIEPVDPTVLQIIHPRCMTAMSLDALYQDRYGNVLIDGLCLTCGHYVHLRIPSRALRDARITVAAIPSSTEITIDTSRDKPETSLAQRVRAFERHELQRSLEEHRGNISRVARHLQMKRATVYARCETLGVGLGRPRQS